MVVTVFLCCVKQPYMSRSDYDCNMIEIFETFQRSSSDIFLQILIVSMRGRMFSICK